MILRLGRICSAAVLTLLLFSQAWAATVYVSNSATNGFASGSDSNTYAQAGAL